MSGFFNSLRSLASGGAAAKPGQDTRMRFSVAPAPGDSGFAQWRDAMRMVARLPGGIPPEFRRRLWLTLAETHLQSRGVQWARAERACLNEWSNPDDEELGVQIVKDLHRTGCSLFCGAGADAERNQATLKRVLLAYARWNKAVGYCQGFNMLAALILQVVDRREADALKVMIYLIEGVLPESYFANNLRGLSVDMAVFRDLLRMRLPALSRHLEALQHDSRDSATGTSYEPPLTNVFTMQWFLTLFCNCLPQPAVLRVWDLVFLEGSEVLLRTALAIWDGLADRILAVDSADEFYSIMGVLTREMLEFGLMDTNNLVKTIVSVAPFPFPGLPELRDKYLYNITPWTHSVQSAARRGLRGLFYSDDDEESADEDEDRIAVAAAYGLSAVFRSPRRRDSGAGLVRGPAVGPPVPVSLAALGPTAAAAAAAASALAPDRERLALDISALKQQYARLRERQRQAHIILSAACGARQPLGPSVPAPAAMNHLLLGKSALLPSRSRRVGPPPGAVPPPAHAAQRRTAGRGTSRATAVTSAASATGTGAASGGETLHWKDAKKRRRSLDIVRSTAAASAAAASASTASPTPGTAAVASDLARRASEAAAVSSTTSSTATGEEEEEDEEGEDSAGGVGGGSGGSGGSGDSGDGGRSSRGSSVCSSSSSSTELCDEPDRMSDFDSEEPTSLSEAASVSPAVPSPERSPLPFAAGSPADTAGVGVPLARGASIPRTVSSFNVLESIAELENSITRCKEDSAPATSSASTPVSPLPPPPAEQDHHSEQNLLRLSPSPPTTVGEAEAVQTATAAGNPATCLSPVPAAPSSSQDDKEFEDFAQQRVRRSSSDEIRPVATLRDRESPPQTSPPGEPLEPLTSVSPVPSEPFSFLESTLAKEFKELTQEIQTTETQSDDSEKELETAPSTVPPGTMADSELAAAEAAAASGRRHSARALRIIQENTEILQRMSQLQHRRSSVPVEQGLGSDSTSPEQIAVAPTPVAAPTPAFVAPNTERRPSGPRRTPSPAVSPATSPPASPPPSPASPGAAAATAERGRRLLDDISALCHPTSPENPAPATTSAPDKSPRSQGASAPPPRRPFSPKTAQFLKSFDELLKPPSPPPTPKAPSPVASPPRSPTRKTVLRSTSPEPPLTRRYTTHFIDSLFEAPRPPSPSPPSQLPTSASTSHLASVTASRSPSTSPAADRRTNEQREIPPTREWTSPLRSLKTPGRQPEDSRIYTSDTAGEGKKRLTNQELSSSEVRKTLRSPSPTRERNNIQRRSRSPGQASVELGDFRRRSYSPTAKTRADKLPTHTSEDIRRQSYSPSTKTLVELSPSRSSDTLDDYRHRSYSPTKTRSEKRADMLEVSREVDSVRRTSPSRILMMSESREEVRSESASVRERPRSPTSHRSLKETVEIPSKLVGVSNDTTRKYVNSPTKKEPSVSVNFSREEGSGDSYDRTAYSSGRSLLSAPDNEVAKDSSGDLRRHSYSPARKGIEGDSSSRENETVNEIKRHSYSPSHRGASTDTDIGSRETSERLVDFQKTPTTRRAYSETSDMKTSDSMDIGDFHKRSYSPLRRLPSDGAEPRRENSNESIREYRRYRSYSPSRKDIHDSNDGKSESYVSVYDDLRYSPSKKTPSDISENRTRDSEASFDHKKSVYSTLEPSTETKKVAFDDYQRKQYSTPTRTHSDLGVSEYSDEYQRREFTKRVEPEASDFSYEEYKNQQYSPSEILELERKARLSIDTSDEYRPFSVSKISPSDSKSLDEMEAMSCGEYHSRMYSSEKRISDGKTNDKVVIRDYHHRLSPTPLQTKSRGSMEFTEDYQRRSYSPSSRLEGEKKTEDRAESFGERKLRPYSPSKRSTSEHKIGEILDDYKRHSYSPSKREVKSGGSLDLLDDYERPPYSPSRRSTSEVKSDDSLDFLEECSLRTSPSRKTTPEHRRVEPFNLYDDYQPSKKSSELHSGDTLELLDDYSRHSYSPSKRSSSDMKSSDSLELLDSYPRRLYSPSSRTTSQSKTEDSSQRYDLRRKTKSPTELMEDTEGGFGDYQRPTRSAITSDVPLGDSGAYGDFRRQTDSPSRKFDLWQDDRGSATVVSSRDKMAEGHGRRSPSAEVARSTRGRATETVEAVGGAGERWKSPPPASPTASTAPPAHEPAATPVTTHVATPATATNAEQAARRPSLRGFSSVGAAAAAARQRRGDSEDTAPPPPPSARSGGGGPRAASASPRRRRRLSDADLLPSPLGSQGRPASPMAGAAPPGRCMSPPPSPFHHAAFHAAPGGAKAFTASAASAFSRYPHRVRERPSSLLLEGANAASAFGVAAPLYKSLSMLSLGNTDMLDDESVTDLSDHQFQHRQSGKRSEMGSPGSRVPKDFCASLPPLRSNAPISPIKGSNAFSPFPTRPAARQPKELGVRLGLYARDAEKSS